MELAQNKGIECLTFIDNAYVLAGVSTRSGGVSTGEYGGLNVGVNTDDDPGKVALNRELLFSTIAPGMEVCYLNQIHSSVVYDADAPSFRSFSDGDGLISTEPGKLLCVTIADCGSVLFHDDQFSIACAIHCGWRGARDGIIGEALRLLGEWTDLSNIHAYVGPMIRQPSYEVGGEFKTMFGSEFFGNKNGVLTFDLNAFIINQLTKANIGSIWDSGYDTYLSPELFFSHRRHPRAGRMCAYIGLKP